MNRVTLADFGYPVYALFFFPKTFKLVWLWTYLIKVITGTFLWRSTSFYKGISKSPVIFLVHLVKTWRFCGDIPLFIKQHSYKSHTRSSERSCIYVIVVSILSLSTIDRLYYGTVPIVWDFFSPFFILKLIILKQIILKLIIH